MRVGDLLVKLLRISNRSTPVKFWEFVVGLYHDFE